MYLYLYPYPYPYPYPYNQHPVSVVVVVGERQEWYHVIFHRNQKPITQPHLAL